MDTGLKVPIKNFHEVTAGLYRGAYPGEKGLCFLKDMGIKTIISFRWRKASRKAEQALVTALGMNFINIPLTYWSYPRQEQIEDFLALLDEESNYPLFVHCFHGADRTGLLIGIFRIIRCGWSFEDAYREMIKCGFHRFHTQHFKWILWRIARNARL